MCSVYAHAFALAVNISNHVQHVSIICSVYVRGCVCVCHIVASLSYDPEPHVQPIRANQKAIIRAWHKDGGSVAVGEF